MYPELFHIGPIVISSFGAMLVTAFIVCNYLLKKEMINSNLDENLADEITTRAAIGGIVGAKLYYIIENFPKLLYPESVVLSKYIKFVLISFCVSTSFSIIIFSNGRTKSTSGGILFRT